MRDTYYALDLVLLENTPAQAETFLHRLLKTVGCISLYVNVNKTEFMCFKQEEGISTVR